MKRLHSNELNLIGIFIGLAAALMILFPALVVGDSDRSYTGIQIAFGHEFVNLGGFATGQIKVSFLNILAYILPIGAAIHFMMKPKQYIIPAILFLVSAILLFLVPESTVTTVTVLGNTNQIDIDWSYGVGLISAIILSIIGFCFSAFRVYKKV